MNWLRRWLPGRERDIASRQDISQVTGILLAARHVALAAIAIIVTGATAASFTESYRGLFDWAREHGLSGVWAAWWPLQVDSFIAVGELALFVALIDRWTPWQRASAWVVTLAGLAVSVAGNIGHVHGHQLSNRATAAVPPLAAAAALAVGLGVLKRVVGQHHQDAAKATREARPADMPRASPERSAKVTTKATSPASRKATAKATGTGPDATAETVKEAIRQGHPVPSARALAKTHHISRDRAGEIRDALVDAHSQYLDQQARPAAMQDGQRGQAPGQEHLVSKP